MAARIVRVAVGLPDVVVATRGDADEPEHLDTLERMAWIARRFPSLRGKPGVDPFDATRLLAWSQSPEPSAGAFHAACCVLAIYNRAIVRFDAIAAMGIWDAAHRDAFVAWARRGWLP